MICLKHQYKRLLSIGFTYTLYEKCAIGTKHCAALDSATEWHITLCIQMHNLLLHRLASFFHLQVSEFSVLQGQL